jgi:hypothetical protein
MEGWTDGRMDGWAEQCVEDGCRDDLGGYLK